MTGDMDRAYEQGLRQGAALQGRRSPSPSAIRQVPSDRHVARDLPHFAQAGPDKGVRITRRAAGVASPLDAEKTPIKGRRHLAAPPPAREHQWRPQRARSVSPRPAARGPAVGPLPTADDSGFTHSLMCVSKEWSLLDTAVLARYQFRAGDGHTMRRSSATQLHKPAMFEGAAMIPVRRDPRAEGPEPGSPPRRTRRAAAPPTNKDLPRRYGQPPYGLEGQHVEPAALVTARRLRSERLAKEQEAARRPHPRCKASSPRYGSTGRDVILGRNLSGDGETSPRAYYGYGRGVRSVSPCVDAWRSREARGQGGRAVPARAPSLGAYPGCCDNLATFDLRPPSPCARAGSPRQGLAFGEHSPRAARDPILGSGAHADAPQPRGGRRGPPSSDVIGAEAAPFGYPSVAVSGRRRCPSPGVFGARERHGWLGPGSCSPRDGAEAAYRSQRAISPQVRRRSPSPAPFATDADLPH
eukprot:TRINITY_DN71165_c0_g1_i1.p1 TRINITY_DN71165_c0_g1~~TRINITY_DN71165_c0_g1_i1.p1  ORF type:complete len:494 (+),score=99.02 TRINITY_DN71165_c0_g1_i1:76-1482(+)